MDNQYKNYQKHQGKPYRTITDSVPEPKKESDKGYFILMTLLISAFGIFGFTIRGAYLVLKWGFNWIKDQLS